MPQLPYDQIYTLLETKLEGLLAVYQFGSFGTPYERTDSDIDLAVLAEKPLESLQLWNLAQELSAILHRPS
jgi:predicted nucleotidyltransferase